MRSGKAEWRVRVDLGHGSFPQYVAVGVAKAGVALAVTCPTVNGERFEDNGCRGYSVFWCGGDVRHWVAAFLGTRPNMSESHSEISTRVPFCIEECTPTQWRTSPPHQNTL